MTKKRKKTIMRTFKIDEISGVDVPAQEGAVALIMKRADAVPEFVSAFNKSSVLTSPEDGHSHLIALNGPPDGVELVSGDTSFQDGHTHPWVMMAGGEIVIGTATGSSGNPHIHRATFMSKADMDKNFAEIFTHAAHPVDGDDDDGILTGVDEDGTPKKKKKKAEKRKFSAEQRKTLAAQGKAMKDGSFPIVTRGDLSNAIRAFGRSDNKAGVSRHIKSRATALGATDMLPETGMLAKNLPANLAGEVGEKETKMSTGKNQKSTDETVADLTKSLALATTMASLSDMEKAHYATLDADTTGADYLAKEAADRTSIAKAATDKIAKAALDSDPVEYTTRDGIELRKSAGVAFISMAKSNDALAKRLEASDAKVEKADLEKRAEAELPNLPGTVEDRAALLKAVDGIEDDGQRAVAMSALTAQNNAVAFDVLGHGNIADPAGSPAADLDAMAKAYATDHAGISEEAAYDAVLKTEKGAALYTKSLN